MYEYRISYYPISYFIETRDTLSGGNFPLGEEALPIDPDPSSLDSNEAYLAEIAEFGRLGWDLKQVVPLLRGCYHEGKHYGYTLTAGYYFIWQRKKEK